MKGLSFPIRLGGHGGLRMSSDDKHVEDDITVLLNTRKRERVMNPQLGNTLDTSLFEEEDVSIEALIKYEIANIFNESGIDIKEKDIDILKKGEETLVSITYRGKELKVMI